MKSDAVELELLKRWERPSSYMGADWPEHYVFLGRHRDSGVLDNSNFDKGLEAIGGTKPNDKVRVVRESHWAVGWVEWIAIHESQAEVLQEAEKLLCALEAYPVIDDEDFSQRQTEEAQGVWERMRVADRIAYIRTHREQFDTQSFSGLLSCVRGKTFCGRDSELLH